MSSIAFPRPLRAGDVVAVTAPSDGVERTLHPRLDLALGELRASGFDVVEGACLRGSVGEVSAPAASRASELRKLWADGRVRAILPPWGGELAIQTLPLLGPLFDELIATHGVSAAPWLMGYSDTSTLLFAITVRTNVATAHGPALMELVPAQRDDVTQHWKSVLGAELGATVMQSSSQRFQRDGADWVDDPAVAFALDQPTRWRGMRAGGAVPAMRIEGRLLGGCLDTITNLVGTPFGDVEKFVARFPREKLILYVENAGMTPAKFCRALWHLRLAGWLDHASGLLVGRHAPPDDPDFTFEAALKDVVGNLDLPVIFDADIGHRPPQLTLVNGARAIVSLHAGGAATVAQTFA